MAVGSVLPKDAQGSERGLDVARRAGAAGLAGFVVFLVALPLHFVGAQPAARLEDTVAFASSVSAARTPILVRTTLADPLIMACLVIFLAGFRQLIKRSRQKSEWVAAAVFGAGLVLIGIELAGDALQAGAARDTSVRAIFSSSGRRGRAASSSTARSGSGSSLPASQCSACGTAFAEDQTGARSSATAANRSVPCADGDDEVVGSPASSVTGAVQLAGDAASVRPRNAIVRRHAWSASAANSSWRRSKNEWVASG